MEGVSTMSETATIRALAPRQEHAATTVTSASSTGSVSSASSRLLTPADWQMLKEQAKIFIDSGLLPKKIQTAQAAIVIMVKGRELGIPAMEALSNIHVIEGKPVCDASLMNGLVLRDHGDDALIVEETTAERCVVRYRRRGWSASRTHAFTIQEAATAGLTGKQTWKNYPQAMLRARCISAVCRMAFPDTLGGMFTAEELGATVEVRDGETVIVEDAATRAAPVNVTPAVAAVAPAEPPAKTERALLLEHLQAARPGEMGIPWINRIADEIGGIQRIEVRDELTVGYLLTLVKRVEERDRRAKAPRAVTRHQTTVVDGPRPLDMPAGAPHDGRAVPEAPPVPPSERPPLAQQFMDKLTEAAGIKDDTRCEETLDLIQDHARQAYDNRALSHDEMSDINTRVADIRAERIPF